jgi:hypothetical protein
MIKCIAFDCFGTVFDANGNPLNWAVWADTETNW